MDDVLNFFFPTSGTKNWGEKTNTWTLYTYNYEVVMCMSYASKIPSLDVQGGPQGHMYDIFKLISQN